MKKLVSLSLVLVLSLLGVTCKAQSKDFLSFVPPTLPVPTLSFSKMKRNTSPLMQKDTITPIKQSRQISIVVVYYTLSPMAYERIQQTFNRFKLDSLDENSMQLVFIKRYFDTLP